MMMLGRVGPLPTRDTACRPLCTIGMRPRLSYLRDATAGTSWLMMRVDRPCQGNHRLVAFQRHVDRYVRTYSRRHTCAYTCTYPCMCGAFGMHLRDPPVELMGAMPIPINLAAHQSPLSVHWYALSGFIHQLIHCRRWGSCLPFCLSVSCLSSVGQLSVFVFVCQSCSVLAMLTALAHHAHAR